MSKRAREEAETKVSTPTKRPRLRINNPFPVLMNRVFGRRMPHFTVPKNANQSQNIGENVLAHNGKRIYGKCTHDDYCVTYKDSNGQDKHVYRHATLGKFDTFLKDKVSSFSSKLTAEIHVDMEKSKILKDGPHCIVHSNALFNSKKSIVKYSQCNSDTVMEGIIHCAIQEYMQNKIGSITAIPALYKVGVIDSDRIAVVMEQVQAPTVFSWLLTVPQRPKHASTRILHMVRSVLSILRMAQCNWDSFRFQHRDLHCGNLLWNEKESRACMFDFDFSAIYYRGNTAMQLPKVLYDRANPFVRECQSRSLDAAIFLRSVHFALQQSLLNNCLAHQKIKALLRNYELESSKKLRQLQSDAGRHLWHLCTNGGTCEFSHHRAIQTLSGPGQPPTNSHLDYMMGIIEVDCMIPMNIHL